MTGNEDFMAADDARVVVDPGTRVHVRVEAKVRAMSQDVKGLGFQERQVVKS